MSWRDAYQQAIRDKRSTLLDARRAGRTHVILGTNVCDPTRMSDYQIEIAAIRDAERVVNMSINLENEAHRKAGRPDEK